MRHPESNGGGKVRLDRLLAEGRARLAGAPFGPSTREAALLLGRVLGLGEAQILARSEVEVPVADARRFRALLERRATGEPIAYIVGEREFYGRPFRVDPRVLIPRPETEHLIEAALQLALPANPRILDVGTGSGCIGVTLALEVAGSTVVATDASPAALAVASGNAHGHAVGGRLGLVASDLTTGLDLASFDLVVSNPPYIDPAVEPTLSIEVTAFEPRRALFAPAGPHSFLARLLSECAGLRAGTPMLLEIGHDQDRGLAELAAASAFALETIRSDLAGHLRTALLVRR